MEIFVKKTILNNLNSTVNLCNKGLVKNQNFWFFYQNFGSDSGSFNILIKTTLCSFILNNNYILNLNIENTFKPDSDSEKEEEEEENVHHITKSNIDDNGQMSINKNSENQIILSIPYHSSPLTYINYITKSKGIFIKLFNTIRVTLKQI